MPVTITRLTICLLLASVVSLSTTCPTLEATGTATKHHVTATRSPLDVAGVGQISRSTPTDDSGHAVSGESPCDNGKLQTGSGNWIEKVNDADWSANAGSLTSTSQGKQWAGDNGPTRQKRYADWANRKKYGGRQARSARVAVGWNKRPRYYREDGSTRDWRTNMMRVWGKRNGRPISGSARMTSLF